MVSHFFVLETINIIYVWNYNDILSNLKDMFLLNRKTLNAQDLKALRELSERSVNVRRVRCFFPTLVARIRTPLFIMLVIPAILVSYEYSQRDLSANSGHYVSVLIVLLFWCIYKIWNIWSYHIFRYQEPYKNKAKSEKGTKREPEPTTDRSIDPITEDRRESDFAWEFVLVLFSVTLSFSVLAAHAARIFVLGDLVIYNFLGHPLDIKNILSTVTFSAFVFVNVFLIALMWKKKVVEKVHRFYPKMALSFIIGVTPVFFYYVAFLVSKFLFGLPL